MAEDMTIHWNLGNQRALTRTNSSISDDILMKLHVHHNTMVIYIQYIFQIIPFIYYLVMVEDRKTGRQKNGWTDVMDGQHRSYIPPHSVADNHY